jgi:hypothetical protein
VVVSPEPDEPRTKFACPYCDETGHRCPHCDGDGFLFADEIEARSWAERLEVFDVSR